MIERDRMLLQLKPTKMNQCPARCTQRLAIICMVEEIALACGIEALGPMAGIQLQYVATENSAGSPPLANGQRSSCNIIGGAEMRADAAALGAKLTQLLLRQEPDETIKDGLHLRAGSVHIALLDHSSRGMKAIVPHRNVGQAMLDEAVLR